MYAYMKRHEAFIKSVLGTAAGVVDWPSLAKYHDTQIRYMQHERLVHLLVLLFVGLFTLVTLLFFIERPTVAVGVLVLLLLALLAPYVLHYFRLENGVQRWYDLANEIERRSK